MIRKLPSGGSGISEPSRRGRRRRSMSGPSRTNGTTRLRIGVTAGTLRVSLRAQHERCPGSRPGLAGSTRPPERRGGREWDALAPAVLEPLSDPFTSRVHQPDGTVLTRVIRVE
jgi:hypothetical protein